MIKLNLDLKYTLPNRIIAKSIGILPDKWQYEYLSKNFRQYYRFPCSIQINMKKAAPFNGDLFFDNNQLIGLSKINIQNFSTKNINQHITFNTRLISSQDISYNTNQFNSSKAIYHLRLFDKKLSARSYNFPTYISSFVILLPLISYHYFYYFGILVSALSIMQCILKIILIVKSFKSINAPICTLSKLPIFSILVPLYMEANIKFIIDSINKLHYPPNLLDIKLVTEADDTLTQKALSMLDVPNHFQIVKVPPSKPRTKPKALNFAAQYVQGEYVVIFDAEDAPDPLQLIKALQNFKTLDNTYVCIQAKLNYYNSDENILTTMQSIEYAILFGYLLPGLANTGNFIPLGGTSCYFKVDILKKIGFWDPFNVTEDLDLGIRIYLKGYKTAVLDSVTLEEAVLSVFAWLKQRTRWIKGFIQSYVVFLHNRNRFNLTFTQKIVIDTIVGIGVFNFIIPVYFIITTKYNMILKISVYSSSLLGILYLFCSSAIVIYKNQPVAENKIFKNLKIIVLFNLYFILHTMAAYMALFQLIFAPFKWNKTLHGISKVIQR